MEGVNAAQSPSSYRDFILDLKRERGVDFRDPEIYFRLKIVKTPRFVGPGSVPRVQSLAGGESKR